MRSLRLLTVSLGAAALVLSACGSTEEDSPSATESSSGSSAAEFPITIEHALGTTTIEEAPERVATVAWANHEVPLALGVVPVGMAAANFGDDDGDGLLPWVSDELEELDAETPVLFDETDGIDFEAVADTEPDLILASYSGLTQEDYDTLSEIAPVVAYPEAPWSTEWRDMILQSSEAMGMAEEGEALVADLETEISEAVAAHPGLEGKKTMFLTHVDTTDLSEVSYYTTLDTRAKFFADLGLASPAMIEEASQESGQFSGTLSAEQVDKLDDVEVIVTYGDEELVKALKADPLLSKMPAVENDAIVLLPNTPLGTAANPTPLSISYVLEDYVDMLAAAAGVE
ncbi:iron-siderophore ABC transporter substrate-binding protein [Nocardioides marmotae]|uniref:ABC transporter substrate-binding protein n=1 Tax=Nocardioides marmotae TaxID=2663857 RepID=A0A6I3JEG8_9ACTN|nr:iron-siderophore ABC transporter substrate-binding protein [Nocardioides marmotae]MCR6032953.1 ABC transporter substrate-binding protein [Gordonia jinghuaiqii]MBC9733483.1 iron-siderophore ABC transporter substrate-binding protein [Nocardioides marmotae]MTB84590.1 ABC transporter substrate-binding protein [Nocardioides marmotae]MTB96604.1 ABC transporter substrate-binding protein [Nocardioides marmotae]QKE01881.1 iron-siderophore ABC transporter substrate-binding protein [Nocardioides marmo